MNDDDVVAVVVVVGGGGGLTMPGLLISPPNTGRDTTASSNNRENNRLMETSVTEPRNQIRSKSVAKDTTSVGEEFKDYWAKMAREGDLLAPIKLAACYEMTGELREGLDLINDFLRRDDLPIQIRSEALLRKAVLLVDSPALAWRTITQASLEVAPELRWRLHNQRGRVLKDQKKYDPAIIEYTAAAYYAEISNDSASVGIAHNNLASIYCKKSLYIEAHESVDKAISLLHDNEYLPQALDQKALIHIEEKDFRNARVCAVNALRKVTDHHHRWRAECLCTLSLAEAGLRRYTESLLLLDAAFDVSTYLNDDNLRLKILLISKRACGMLYDAADEAAVRLALNLAGGKLRQAAKSLDMAHPSLLKSLKKYAVSYGQHKG